MKTFLKNLDHQTQDTLTHADNVHCNFQSATNEADLIHQSKYDPISHPPHSNLSSLTNPFDLAVYQSKFHRITLRIFGRGQDHKLGS